jgi:hypothetical protein
MKHLLYSLNYLVIFTGQMATHFENYFSFKNHDLKVLLQCFTQFSLIGNLSCDQEYFRIFQFTDTVQSVQKCPFLFTLSYIFPADIVVVRSISFNFKTEWRQADNGYVEFWNFKFGQMQIITHDWKCQIILWMLCISFFFSFEDILNGRKV